MPHGLRVLIVEDVPVEAELVLRQLAEGGMPCAHLRVDTEGSFRAALLRFRPHIILSDFTLPAFDGLSALDIARHEAPHVPFIFVSGTIGEERAIEAIRSGATDYVLKNNLRRLGTAVKRALVEYAERSEAREQFERAYLQQQLLLCNGKVGQLAKRVGMERTHLYRKLRSLGVDFRNISED